MIVQGKKILKKRLLVNGDEKNLANATYNLTIGAILYNEAEQYSIQLKPGEIACVVSKEVFGGRRDDFTALVNLKSSLTKKGILALDTGYVDPTYEGPIGTILVNFSKNSVPIRKGQQFFRVMFFEHDGIGQDRVYTPKTYDSDYPKKALKDYICDQEDILASNFANDFLNTESLREEIIRDLRKKIEPEVYSKATGKIISHNWLALITLIGALLIAATTGFNKIVQDVADEVIKSDYLTSENFIGKVSDKIKDNVAQDSVSPKTNTTPVSDQVREE